MFHLKRILAGAVAAVSACTLIISPSAFALTDEEAEYEAMIRQKLAEREAYEAEFGDPFEEGTPTYNYEELDPEFAKIATIFGDVNFDKLVGVADAVQMLRYLLGETEDLGNWFNADLNQDGVVNVLDFTLLKQQICGNGQKKGGSAAIKLVDLMTGEPIDGGYMSLFCVYDNTWSYEIGSWKNKKDATAFFNGLPNDDPKYVYYINVSNLPKGYGNILGNCGQQFNFSYAEGETGKAINVRLISNEDEKNPNVSIKQMDWAMDKNILENGYNYGWVTILDREGNMYYQRVDYDTCALPDGEYRAVLHPYSEIWSDYGMIPLDPESDFAKHVRSNHPDADLTDKSAGIDFTVKNGKADREIVFDFAPQPGYSNSIKVSCLNGVTGEPLEGVEVSLIEAPDTYAKKIATWISDETGTHTFTDLYHTGYNSDNRAYKISIDSLPAGYEGDREVYSCTSCLANDTDERTFYFYETEGAKQLSADVVKLGDGTLLNDGASFDIYRFNSENVGDITKVVSNIKAGEKFAIQDGEYVAILNSEVTGYAGIDLFSEAGKALAADLNEDDFYGNTCAVRFRVKDGAADKALKFYVIPAEN